MPEFSRQDFENLGEQARKIMNEQSRARKNGPPYMQSASKPTPSVEPPPKAEKKTGNSLLQMFNFKDMELDGDRMIIIALALILASGESDDILILALIYIML